MNRASVILYYVEAWTLLKAFHMRSLRRILWIRWFDHVTNMKVNPTKGTCFFWARGPYATGIPAHDALWTALRVGCGSAPGLGWKRGRGQTPQEYLG